MTIKQIIKRVKLLLISDKAYLLKRYKKNFGYTPDLNNIQTFNEFLLFRKLYPESDLLTLCADKYAVREYIKDKIGEEYLIPLIGKYSSFDSIDFSILPDSFVIKANHGSGQNEIVLDKSKIETSLLKKKTTNWLQENNYHRTREKQYKEIKPLLIIEKLMLNNNEIPDDIKLHCINGSVEFIQVDSSRFENHQRRFYSKDWLAVDFTFSPIKNGKPKYTEQAIKQKPENLEKIVEIAEILSKEFSYVRVDLYNINKKIYFGELTFTHENGSAHFFPEKYDKIFLEKMNKSN